LEAKSKDLMDTLQKLGSSMYQQDQTQSPPADQPKTEDKKENFVLQNAGLCTFTTKEEMMKNTKEKHTKSSLIGEKRIRRDLIYLLESGKKLIQKK